MWCKNRRRRSRVESEGVMEQNRISHSVRKREIARRSQNRQKVLRMSDTQMDSRSA